MTRKEEITRESWKRYPNSPERNFGTGDYEYPEYHDAEREAFEAGAEWADKTIVEKACEWIIEHIDIPYEGKFIDDSPVASDYVEYLSKRLEYAKAIADAFKQAMEE